MKLERKTTAEPVLRTSIDLAAIVFDGDRDLRKQIAESRRLSSALADAQALAGGEGPKKDSLGLPPPGDGRRDLLRRGVRLSRKLAPTLWRCVDRCRDVLGLEAELELFVEPEPMGNAFVLPPRNGRVSVCFTSGAMDLLDEDELTSVVGHELGHAVFRHHDLRPLLDFPPEEGLAPVEAMRLYAWMRYAELTADRVGLLCCGDLDAAVRAEFKLASGLSQSRYLANAREAMAQLDALAEGKLESAEEDWFATHPYSPMRLHALDLFARSTAYAKLTGKGEGTVGERQLESRVAEIMELMNPSFLSEKLPSRGEVRELLLLGAAAVALADEKLARSEVDVLEKLAKGADDDVKAALKLGDAARNARIDELAAKLKVGLPPIRAQKIVEDLTAVALADGTMTPDEQETLAALAERLGVDPFFVEDAMARPEDALD